MTQSSQRTSVNHRVVNLISRHLHTDNNAFTTWEATECLTRQMNVVRLGCRSPKTSRLFTRPSPLSSRHNFLLSPSLGCPCSSQTLHTDFSLAINLSAGNRTHKSHHFSLFNFHGWSSNHELSQNHKTRPPLRRQQNSALRNEAPARLPPSR